MGGPVVTVRAPSRIHFGLLSFNRPHERQFGGAGLMVQSPGLEVRLVPAASFEVAGPLADRVEQAARRWGASRAISREALPACRIEVLRAPPMHVGLGVGTQLALSVAAGLHAFVDAPLPDAAALASSVGRGERSAVGTYGFLEGGLLVEAGKRSGQSLSPLLRRVEVPHAWRFVVVIPPPDKQSMSGAAERKAFAQLPAVDEQLTARMCQTLFLKLLPAVLEADFVEFSRGLLQYGELAGSCYAALQGGIYSSSRAAHLVETLRGWGVEGVVQSSWGPTLCAAMPDADSAEAIAARLRDDAAADCEVFIAQADNRGAHVRFDEA